MRGCISQGLVIDSRSNLSDHGPILLALNLSLSLMSGRSQTEPQPRHHNWRWDTTSLAEFQIESRAALVSILVQFVTFSRDTVSAVQAVFRIPKPNH